MAIIVEDGTGLANSNSYVNIDEVRAFAEMRGTTLPADDSDVEALMHSAMDYIEMRSGQFVGTATNLDQALSWPRFDAYISGLPFPDDSIPKQLKRAQLHLTIEASKSALVANFDASKLVKRKKIAVLETEYSEAALLAFGTQPTFPIADGLLDELMSTTGAPLRSYRI